MSNKVKVPGGAFYAGDGLTVDPITRTVSAGGGDVTTPDWNQNDATASDYIKNRPFYDKPLVSVQFQAYGGELYKVSDSVPTGDHSVGASCIVVYGLGGEKRNSDVIISTDDYYAAADCYVFVALKDNVTVSEVGLTLPEKGTYFLSTANLFVSGFALGSDVDPEITWDGSTGEIKKIDRKYLPTPFKPEGKSYLTFSSPNSFTLEVVGKTKRWDGTLEYFASDGTWATWNGISVLSAVYDYGEYVLYLRGTGNTVITGDFEDIPYSWVLTGTDISSVGNIENLLDYATVTSGGHPTMTDYCYLGMFRDCTSLTHAPALPATELTNGCYDNMFYGCTSLTHAPALPATTLIDYCYSYMFYGCTSLTHAPALPATELTNSCYGNMFYGCTSLTEAPALPATTLADSCYAHMFYGCTSLTHAPALPATTLANYCYDNMFYGCTSLIQAPALPATTLANYCYSGMFKNCTSLKLSSTQTDEYTQEYRIPSSGNGTTATGALLNMFSSTGGTFTGTPEINTTYYLSTDNMIVRETDIATLNGYVGSMINAAIDKYECIIPSSTPDSTKKFKITVDDSGTISATEVTA